MSDAMAEKVIIKVDPQHPVKVVVARASRPSFRTWMRIVT